MVPLFLRISLISTSIFLACSFSVFGEGKLMASTLEGVNNYRNNSKNTEIYTNFTEGFIGKPNEVKVIESVDEGMDEEGVINLTSKTASPSNIAEFSPKLDLYSTSASAYIAGEPILVITSATNPFSTYLSEILLAEGLNEFITSDISTITSNMLDLYDVILIGEIPVTDAQALLLGNWVDAGGTIIAFKPDTRLAPYVGLTAVGGSLSDKYLLINTTSGPGKGLVSETIQYHSAADLYTLNGATSLATLYSDANTATIYPAVSSYEVGTNGGKAVVFTYDLARSVVYTRQGNPLWAGQERDGSSPIRSNDMFFPDWIDLDKVAIPQADEQQRLLANIIIQNNKKPLPRFWYLPRGLKAAVVMTGDDHASGGTKARFDHYLELSDDNSAAAVADWRAIRGSSYIYPNSPITNQEAKYFEDQGFEIALHLSSNCADYTYQSLENDLTSQLATMQSNYPSLSDPVTNRTHCIAFSDWASQPKLEVANGIRLDANYYYWPETWVQDRPGLFTGSGMAMRFADLDGSLIDIYQLNTQMTDESGQSFPETIDELLDKALGVEGYYGVFCANMHTDADTSEGSEYIIASAKSRDVPVISSKQILTWLDGRNESTFHTLSWNQNILNFSMSVANGAHKLEGMLPFVKDNLQVSSITSNGNPVTFRKENIKGMEYVFFPASTGEFNAVYGLNEQPSIAITAPSNNADFTAPAQIIIEADALDTDGSVTKVEFYEGVNKLGEVLTSPFSFNWENVPEGAYAITAKVIDDQGGSSVSSIVNVNVKGVCPCTVFEQTDIPDNELWNDVQALQLGMKFQTMEDGYITGVRFYKQSGNTGTHTGQLYSIGGTLLAEAVFTNETASGWQEVAFSNPVAVTANSSYVISYHSSEGYYSADTPFFINDVLNEPLRGLADGENGSNGVYRYSNTPVFPTQSYQSSNYWVDAVFNFGEDISIPPVVTIDSPVENTEFTSPADVLIEVSASDADGFITKVEFFEGTTKLGEVLDSPYSFNWNNVSSGNYSLTAIATDNEGEITTSEAINITVADPPSPDCPCTVFQSTDYPTNNLFSEGQGLQLGMKFRAIEDGYITGVRFYKQIGNSGVHTGQLYSLGGILLAEVVFANETSSGWQEMAFSTPVPILANTTYIISYHTNNGHYSASNQFFSSAVENVKLKGLANGEDGPNGVYRYATNPSFPNQSYQSGNYWVDAVFNTSTALNIEPSITLSSPINNTDLTTPTDIIFEASASDADGSITKVEFFQGSTKLGEDLSSPYSFNWSNVATGNYILTAVATDNEGATTTSVAVNVSVVDPQVPVCPCTVFEPTDIPSNILFSDGQGLQLGMKFRSTQDGEITGVRFYKQSGNTGTHTGQLYSGTGTLLAEAVFTNETSSGWQEVSFSSVVPITANTTYVVSYHSSNGYYSADNQYFNSAVVNNPLRALANGEDGGNGVYKYSGTPSFPDQTYQSGNYWVDVVFNTPQVASLQATLSLDPLMKTSISTQSTEEALSDVLSVYPNPFSAMATLNFVVQEGGDYIVSLYDSKGAFITQIKQGSAAPGDQYFVEIDGEGMAPGVYLLRLKTQRGTKTFRIILNR
ncbi:DUF4082 domain-containing protein [Gillisia sp. M10.2A]|uniref:DUF4082 domain-containing protein n=1 Tax=Gillisia lutea TaxID=2909668 RepID=A0ABS9EK08_9FLAO|nr:DUF4082 domain-containing protein [Gillisia lutea]MCF4102194.1 DUF4082 domain-containing protein [Gillisia lutea]